LEFPTGGGPQKLQCWNTEGIFRLIQSIPSPKAEPFKRWLAKVGYERVQEIEDPELASKRTRALYKAKGYSDAWIEKRMRSIAIRDELTGEWKKRGVKEHLEYSILTAEISKAAFGLTPSEYAEHKGLRRQNLRDHMTDLELIFSMLGEAATSEITRTKDGTRLSAKQTRCHRRRWRGWERPPGTGKEIRSENSQPRELPRCFRVRKTPGADEGSVI
jgi:DNA-damage-inducible protein D